MNESFGQRLRFFRSRAVCAGLISLLLQMLPIPGLAAAWQPEAEIRGFLRNAYPWADVEITDLRVSGSLPAEKPSAVLVEKTPPGRAVFRLEFAHGRSVTATALVRTFDRVFMSRSALGKGSILRQEDIYATLLESSRIPKGAVRDPERIVGKPLLRSVVANTPVTDTMVAESPVVKRGRMVMLVIESPSFSVKTIGETRQDAVVGEYVKAVNSESKKVMTGLLVDENTVRVEY